MIKTETERHIIINSHKAPDDVIKALKKMDSKLELFWNSDDNQWEIYRLKKHAVNSSQDILCWQMSAPTKGSLITPGIVDWLKQFNTNPQMSKSKEELNREFLSLYKRVREKNHMTRRKSAFELEREKWNIGRWFTVQHKQICVPITVGFNKKTGKKILAVKNVKRIPG